jgi:hypothetical protein
MSSNLTNGPITQSAAETPSTSPKLAPEAVVEQLRTMQSQIDGLSALSKTQRQLSRRRARQQSVPVIAASMGVISSSDAVATAVGQPVDEVLQLQQDEGRWGLVAEELRKFLKGIEGANLLRRERLALIASQAYSVGAQMVRNPANSDLVPHVEEVERLKSVTRRKKKATPAPQPSTPTTATPAPATQAPVPQAPASAPASASTPGHDTTTKPQT